MSCLCWPRPQADDRAKSLRQSVDVMRLSRIALSNLEKEGDGRDYTGEGPYDPSH